MRRPACHRRSACRSPRSRDRAPTPQCTRRARRRSCASRRSRAACPPRVSSRTPVEIAGLGQHDADVRQRRLHQHGGDVAVVQRPLQRVEVVERHHRVVERRVDLGADCPGRRTTWPGRPGSPRLVDRAVVAPVHHRDLRPTREMPGEAQHEPVRVGRASSPTATSGARTGGPVPRRPRRRPPAGSIVVSPIDAWRSIASATAQPWPRHRTGVAEAQVDVLDAVDVDETRPAASATWIGKAPGHRVIQGIGTPATRWAPPSWRVRPNAGSSATKRSCSWRSNS